VHLPQGERFNMAITHGVHENTLEVQIPNAKQLKKVAGGNSNIISGRGPSGARYLNYTCSKEECPDGHVDLDEAESQFGSFTHVHFFVHLS
jgi:hypothetical protein